MLAAGRLISDDDQRSHRRQPVEKTRQWYVGGQADRRAAFALLMVLAFAFDQLEDLCRARAG
jgi:hypothetical protein